MKLNPLILKILIGMLFSCQKREFNNSYNEKTDPESWKPNNIHYELISKKMLELI
jgi:hypothetical protein